MAGDEFVIRLIPEGMKSGDTTESQTGGGAGIGDMAGLGKLGAIVGLISLAMEPLKPMLKAIQQLGKMVGEFLRPIADVVTIMLQPILSMLRPILITFKALMAPFKEAAMTGIAAANQLIGKGMQLGPETKEGSELIKEGFKGSMKSASLLFSGFIESMFTPLADAMGIGNAFSNAMDKWQDSALQGVHRSIMLSDTVSELTGEFGDLETGAKTALQAIDGQMQALRDIVGTFTIEGFRDDLETTEKISKTTLDILKGDIDKLKSKSEDLNTPFSTLMGQLTAGVEPSSTLGKNMKDLISDMKDLNKEMAERAAVGAGKGIAAQETNESKWAMTGAGAASGAVAGGLIGSIIPGIGTAIGAGAGGIIGGGLGFLGAEIGSRQKEKEKQYASWAREIIDTTQSMNNSVTETYKNANQSILDTTKSNFNTDNGVVVETFGKGLGKMNSSNATFVESLGNFTDRTKSYADRIAGYLEDAKESASDARSAANDAENEKAKAKESSLSSLLFG